MPMLFILIKSLTFFGLHKYVQIENVIFQSVTLKYHDQLQILCIFPSQICFNIHEISEYLCQ